MPGPCRIALIGQKFMGKAHANAWTQAPHHFTLPRRPVLPTTDARIRSLAWLHTSPFHSLR